MVFIKETEEVYRSQGSIAQITAANIAFLKARAKENERKRVRLCSHPDSENLLHEMIIVHTQHAYVPPHRHLNKSESFHIIEGKLSVFLFNDTGQIIDVIPMGNLESNRIFYYRLSSSLYHSVLPESEFVVFHEVTNGPFNRKDMVIAPWAANEDDENAQMKFVKLLSNSITKTQLAGLANDS
jgi:cupin fold WbuC family metalloprotein